MELKHFKILFLFLFLTYSSFSFSQMKISYVNGLVIKINLKKDKDTIKIFENENFKVLYLIDKTVFDKYITKKQNKTTRAVFFYYSKKEDIGLCTYVNYGQSIIKLKRNIYNLIFRIDENRVVPYMLLLDKNMKSKFLVKYNKLQNFKSEKIMNSISIQDNLDYCNRGDFNFDNNLINLEIEMLMIKKNDIKRTTNKTNCLPLFDIQDIK